MSSERKILSARINGAKSRGPKTPEGKLASSQNARTHGLTAESIVIEGEAPDEFNTHWQDFIDEHQPQTKTEHELVHRLAISSWRLRRGYTREASIINLKMLDLNESVSRQYTELTPADRAAYAFASLADYGNSLAVLNRYETRDRRAFDQALKILRDLQSKRESQNFPKEPNPANGHHATPDLHTTNRELETTNGAVIFTAPARRILPAPACHLNDPLTLPPRKLEWKALWNAEHFSSVAPSRSAPSEPMIR